jgi:polyhydroxybutyrate depolymerase
VTWSKSRWPVDSDRIFVTGASNGGMMSYRLAMEAPGFLAAAGAIIANLPEPSECPGPFTPLPILIMNGTADPLMPWGGGCVGLSGCGRGSVSSTLETVSFWTEIDGTRGEPRCIDLPNANILDGSTVTSCTWIDGTGGSEVVLYRIEGGGHAPPGPDPLPLWYRLIAGPKNHDISAPDETWTFFERHRRISASPRQGEGRSPN